jgi:hypothetical protein
MGWFDKLYAWLYERPGEEPVREPIDCGGGLFRLPDPDPKSGKTFDTRTDSWITFEEAAKATLDLYEAGQWSAQGGTCPRCYEVTVDGNAAFLAESHPNPAARRRWAAAHEEHQAMIAALGDCRCGQHKTLYEAAREAQIFNAPYLGRMG